MRPRYHIHLYNIVHAKRCALSAGTHLSPPLPRSTSTSVALTAASVLRSAQKRSDFDLLLRPILVEHDPDHEHRAGRDRQRADHRQLFEDSDNGCPPANSLPPCHTHTETPFDPQQQCGLSVSTKGPLLCVLTATTRLFLQWEQQFQFVALRSPCKSRQTGADAHFRKQDFEPGRPPDIARRPFHSFPQPAGGSRPHRSSSGWCPGSGAGGCLLSFHISAN